MTDKINSPFSRATPPASPASKTALGDARAALSSVKAPSLPMPEREFQFSSSDFERVRELIYKHAGISLSPIKQDMVYSRLARRLRARGDRTFAEYLEIGRAHV